MLILPMHPRDSVHIGDDVEVTLLTMQSYGVRLGVVTPPGLKVLRSTPADLGPPVLSVVAPANEACPFCKSIDLIYRMGRIRCQECLAYGPYTNLVMEYAAWEKWNQRGGRYGR